MQNHDQPKQVRPDLLTPQLLPLSGTAIASSLDSVRRRLEYRRLFRESFPSISDSPILAQHLRCLVDHCFGRHQEREFCIRLAARLSIRWDHDKLYPAIDEVVGELVGQLISGVRDDPSRA
jgi:hypothetical protein